MKFQSTVNIKLEVNQQVFFLPPDVSNHQEFVETDYYTGNENFGIFKSYRFDSKENITYLQIILNYWTGSKFATIDEEIDQRLMYVKI